jgi:5-methylcytosine-specific restriction endonuclease McrBC regulatory subunit McrC
VRIVATERRKRSLSSAEWEAVANNEAFWRLVENGFVSVVQIGVAKRELRGQKYVGRAIVGRTELIVQEKVPGTLAALLAFATGSDVLLARAEAAAADFDAVSRALMQEFVRGAGAYVANRRVPEYEYNDAVGASLGGSLDVPRTMRLHARGLSHLVAFAAGSVVRNTALDKVTLAALDEIDRSGTALGLLPETVYTSRWLAGALEEVRDSSYYELTHTDLLGIADDVITVRDTALEDRDLARLAAVILLHQGFDWTAATTDLVPRAWFIDVESLFEHAVRTLLQQLIPGCHVDRGEHFARRLFADGGDRSRVNPDIVVHDSKNVSIAADVKYKSLRASEDADELTSAGRRKKPGRPDLYQLLVHAKALHAPKAVLIYPSDVGYQLRYLGRSTTGAETWVTEVRPWALSTDLGDVAKALGSLA